MPSTKRNGISTGIEPVEDLLFDVRVTIAARNYLHRQIRRLRQEPFDLADCFDAGPAHEGHVRRAHCIWIAVESRKPVSAA